MIPLLIIFGSMSGCFLAVLVGILGARRRLGFGWSFLLSLFLTPLGGLICVLLSDPLPAAGRRYGCFGCLFAALGLLCLAAFLLVLLTGAASLAAL